MTAYEVSFLGEIECFNANGLSRQASVNLRADKNGRKSPLTRITYQEQVEEVRNLADYSSDFLFIFGDICNSTSPISICDGLEAGNLFVYGPSK